MSQAFQDLMEVVAGAARDRVINHPKADRMSDYANGNYSPFFTLFIENGKPHFVWCTHFSKKKQYKGLKEVQRVRFTGGGKWEGFECKEEWDEITLSVMHALKLEL